MSQSPFSLVHHRVIQVQKMTGQTVKLCYVSRTIYGDYILLNVLCTEQYAKVNVCDWEFKASSEDVLSFLMKNNAKWFGVLTRGMTILQAGSIEMDNFDIFGNVKDDLKLSIPISMQIDPSKMAGIYLKKWKELKS